MEDCVGHFSKHMIPLFKALVAQRWKEGNPICVGDPMEYMIPYYTEIFASSMEEKDRDGTKDN